MLRWVLIFFVIALVVFLVFLALIAGEALF